MEKDKVVSEDDNIVFINNRCYVLDPENGIENPENVFLEFIGGSKTTIRYYSDADSSFSDKKYDLDGPLFKVYHRMAASTYMEYFVFHDTLFIDHNFMSTYGLRLTQKNWGFEFVICDLVKKYLGWNVRDIKFY